MDIKEKSTRVRYSEELRQQVIQEVLDYNLKNKRGGQKVAAEKHGITQITISNWMKKAKATKGTRRLGKKDSALLFSQECEELIARLAEVHHQIRILEPQLENLNNLKAEAAQIIRQLR